MKIKVTALEFDKLKDIPVYEHKKPIKMNRALKWLVNVISKGEFKETNFKYEEINMDKIAKNQPVLILMNHSSFIDLKIVMKLFKDKDFSIVCTDDGFVGKEGLIRHLGCIPTKKFLSDPLLVKDMVYATKKLNNSILMYPEATYTFDGRSAILPDSLGKCIKLLKVPVVTIITSGAFLRDPLYNNLQLRKVNVSAKAKMLLSIDDINSKSVDEINEMLKNEFSFDGFKEQIEKKICVNEPFRADYLNRILYKCPHCKKEGFMIGKGTHITCSNCNNSYELDEYGSLHNENGDTLFNNVPDWYDFEKEELYKEIDEGTYNIHVNVEIYALKNMKTIYHIGSGQLDHSANGFVLDGCDGKLHYEQSNRVSYSLYSDYYWYELGDMICVGNNDIRYYCIIKDNVDVASKARLAVQYLYSKSK